MQTWLVLFCLPAPGSQAVLEPSVSEQGLRIKVTYSSQRHRGRRGRGESEGLDTAQSKSLLLIRSLCPLCFCVDEGARSARGGQGGRPSRSPRRGTGNQNWIALRKIVSS